MYGTGDTLNRFKISQFYRRRVVIIHRFGRKSFLFQIILPFFLGCQRAVLEAIAGLVNEVFEGRELPDADGIVKGCRDDALAVGADGGRIDLVSMPF